MNQSHLVALLNELSVNEWNQLLNFFIPSSTLVANDRDGVRIKKTAGQASLQRLLDSSQLPDATQHQLQTQFERLIPIEL